MAYLSIQQLKRLKMWSLQFVVKNVKNQGCGTFKVEIEERRVTGNTKNDRKIVLYVRGCTC